MELARGLDTLLYTAVVAALAPVLVALLPGPRIPQVVVLLAGGVLIGPEALGWADRAEIDLLANVGLGFLFLLAGYELDLGLFRERAGRLAMAGWLVTLALAAALVGALAAAGLVRAFVVVALGLTTTAFGTLLPILRDNDLLGGRFGRYLLAAGAVGELFPIFAIALFLGASNKFVALGSLAAVGVLAVVLTFAPRLVRGNKLGQVLREGEGSTAQTTVRLTVLLLLLLLAVAEEFGLDVVLGAFLAGIVLRRWAPGDVHALEGKLDAIGYGFFIPLFFVASGMSLDVRSIAGAPLRLAAFFVLLLVVRGVPALFLYRRDLPAVRRVQLMLLTATALPLLVALAEIGVRNGTMLRENAAALVGAGALSVLVFPMAAVVIERRRRAAVTPAASAPSSPE
jgi:Kef-type K+ transport system membrane component KefB